MGGKTYILGSDRDRGLRIFQFTRRTPQAVGPTKPLRTARGRRDAGPRRRLAERPEQRPEPGEQRGEARPRRGPAGPPVAAARPGSCARRPVEAHRALADRGPHGRRPGVLAEDPPALAGAGEDVDAARHARPAAAGDLELVRRVALDPPLDGQAGGPGARLEDRALDDDVRALLLLRRAEEGARRRGGGRRDREGGRGDDAWGGPRACRYYGRAARPSQDQRKRRSRSALSTTETLESAIARPAISGLSRPAAASGRAATL